MEETRQDLTKKELMNRVEFLLEENKKLKELIQQLDYSNAFKRLDYLFKAVENKDSLDEKFIEYCSKEIVSIMVIEDASEGTNKAE